MAVPTKPSASLPPTLQEGIAQRRLVIFCGAGLSMLYPSCLLSWWDFNRVLLEEAKRYGSELLQSSREATDGIAQLTMDKLRVETFSDTIVTTFAGDSYFPVLDVLEGTTINANHIALAELARRGILRAIVTTNFDTLIERAFRTHGVPLTVLADASDYEQVPFASACTLYKVHGSVSSPASLVDTVSQKLRGIPIHVRSRLSTLFRQHHVLVVGHSGADLSFGEDYFGFSAIDESTPGITWLVRPGAAPRPGVLGIVERAGSKGAILDAELPDVFEHLGIETASVPVGTCDDGPNGVETQARIRARDFFEEPHIGPFTCAAFCASLLAVGGNYAAADAVEAALATHPSLAGPAVPLGAGITFRVLALGAFRRRDWKAAEHWSLMEQAYHSATADLIDPDGNGPSSSARVERHNNHAALQNNLALLALYMGRNEDARLRLEEALLHADMVGNVRLLGLIYSNLATLQIAEAGDTDRSLQLLRTSRGYATEAGMAQTLFESNLSEAKLLTELGEYDAALSALDAARSHAELVRDEFGARIGIETIHAEVELRRGLLTEALQRLVSLAREAHDTGAPDLAAQISAHEVHLLGRNDPRRSDLIAEVDRQLSDENSAAIGNEAEVARHHQALRTLREHLSSDEIPDGMLFLFDMATDDPEGRIRHHLMKCEFQSDVGPLPGLLLKLARLKYNKGEPARVKDLAKAAIMAAERSNDDGLRLEGENLLGIAYDLLGEPAAALDYYKWILAVPYAPARLIGQVQVHAALVASRLGHRNEAEDWFRKAIASLTAIGETEDALRAHMGLARHFARYNDLDAALVWVNTALESIDRVADLRARPTLEQLRDMWELRRRMQAHPHEPLQHVDIERLVQLPKTGVRLSMPQLKRHRKQAETPQALANLGLVAFQSDQPSLATQYVNEAKAAYEQRGDRLGVSRCLNNLAQFAAENEDWDDAIEMSRRALAIRKASDDQKGQLLTLSMLAHYSLAKGDLDQAIRYGRDCLHFSVGQPPSRHRAVAWLALNGAFVQQGDKGEAWQSAAAFLDEVMNLDDDAELQAIASRLAPTMAPDPPLPVIDKAPSNLWEEMQEVERLRRIGQFNEALALLERLLNVPRT